MICCLIERSHLRNGSNDEPHNERIRVLCVQPIRIRLRNENPVQPAGTIISALNKMIYRDFKDLTTYMTARNTSTKYPPKKAWMVGTSIRGMLAKSDEKVEDVETLPQTRRHI